MTETFESESNAVWMEGRTRLHKDMDAALSMKRTLSANLEWVRKAVRYFAEVEHLLWAQKNAGAKTRREGKQRTR